MQCWILDFKMAKEENENMKVARDMEKRVGLVRWRALRAGVSPETLEAVIGEWNA